MSHPRQLHLCSRQFAALPRSQPSSARQEGALVLCSIMVWGRTVLLGCMLALLCVACTTAPSASGSPAISLGTPTPSGAGAPSLETSNTAVVPPISSPGVVLYRVIEVVDGDTVKVSKDGRTETLRLIGIDTPEVVDPRKPVQCFGREASARAKELLSAQRVRIAEDPTQDTRDKYGRLLVYLWLEDGTFFNLQMVQEGYAHEYTYDVPYRHQTDFRAAQQEARNAGRRQRAFRPGSRSAEMDGHPSQERRASGCRVVSLGPIEPQEIWVNY